MLTQPEFHTGNACYLATVLTLRLQDKYTVLQLLTSYKETRDLQKQRQVIHPATHHTESTALGEWRFMSPDL